MPASESAAARNAVQKAYGILRQRLLGFETLLPAVAVVAREPEGHEEHERGARAHRADVVRPCRAQEARVLVVSWRDDGHHSGALDVSPSTYDAPISYCSQHATREIQLTPCACD